MGRDNRRTFDNEEYRFGKGDRREKRKSKRKYDKDHLKQVKDKHDWWDYENEVEWKRKGG
tara:strand:- start:175 stop:354 length:180 start_codon:yes stop_codon:yes gene_type:complete